MENKFVSCGECMFIKHNNLIKCPFAGYFEDIDAALKELYSQAAAEDIRKISIKWFGCRFGERGWG
jgi:hypothetical protein